MPPRDAIVAITCCSSALLALLLGCGSEAEPPKAGADPRHGTSTDAAPEARDPDAGNENDGPTPDREPREDASLDDAPDDKDATAPPPDAMPDTADAPTPHPVSRFCGDGIRDPVKEECDDGPGDGGDSCAADCRVRDVGVVPPGGLVRTLGAGRHVASAGADGFAVVYEEFGAEVGVRLQAFGESGRPSGGSLNVGSGARPSVAANPVVAALPDQSFAVAWTDVADGTPDIALRVVRPGVVPDGVPQYANVEPAGSQQDPDVLWTGSELVVAWSDVFSVRARRFDASLGALDGERTLSSASALAGNVALARFGKGWAAAFRANDRGLESVTVSADGASWSTPGFVPAPEGDHPALLQLDETHLLVFFTQGASSPPNGSRLYTAIVDIARAGLLQPVAFVPKTSPYDRDTGLRQRRPAAARVGDRLFLAWETDSAAGDPLGTEAFLAEVSWSPSAPTALRQLEEWPMPLTLPRRGDQRRPALAESPLFPQGALIMLWDDESRMLPERPLPDVMLGFRPTPFVVLPDADGG